MKDRPVVLIVDDETDVTEVVSFWLRREGLRVLTASEAAEGLALAQAERPAVIVLDVMMPGISGLEMLERIRATPEINHIPVIMLTVLADARDLREAARHGVAAYIRKPFKPEDVVAAVSAVLGESGGS